jgi:hypothetical protein
MEFLDIASLGTTYKYVVKIEQKFKLKQRDFGSANPSQLKQGKGNPNSHSKGPSRDGLPQNNSSKMQHKKGNEKTKKDTGKWCEYHKIPWHNTDECHSKQSLVPRSLPLKSVQANQKNHRKGNTSFTRIRGSRGL